MKVRIYRLQNPQSCGTPQQSRFFDQKSQPQENAYFYACELVYSDKTENNSGDSNKIGYMDDVVLPIHGAVTKADLFGLELKLNAENKFLLMPELSTLVNTYLKDKVVAKENEENVTEQQQRRIIKS